MPPLLQGEVLSPGLRDEAASAQASGVDRVMGGQERSGGLGFAVEEDGFGMGGVRGSLGWACRSALRLQLRHRQLEETTTAATPSNALRDAVGLPPL